MTNILVAEDNASLRRLMGIHLRRAGYRVTEAADGLDALEDKRTGFHAGADDYLTKPVDFEELLLRVEALFARDDMK